MVIEVNKQPQVRERGYEEGADILYNFFRKELKKFLTPELDKLGVDIIECCLHKGTLDDYIKLMPMSG